jgi:hypothetical protein
MRQEVHREFKGVVNMNTKLFGFLWRQIDRFAAREENGYERLSYLPDEMPSQTQPKKRKRAKKDATKLPPKAIDEDVPAGPKAAVDKPLAKAVTSVRREEHDQVMHLPTSNAIYSPSLHKRAREETNAEPMSTDGDDDRPLTDWVSPKKADGTSARKKAKSGHLPNLGDSDTELAVGSRLQ